MAHYLTIVPLSLLLVNITALGDQKPPSAGQLPHTIRFFFKPLNQKSLFDIPQSMLIPYLGDPQKLNRATIRQNMSAKFTSGIEVLYGGEITYSDANGEVILPRLHDSETITLIIIPRISPIVRHGTTVQYITVGSPQKALWYSIERIQDKEHKKSFWNVKRQQPQDKIPSYALIILQEPKDIILEEGIYFAEEGHHLALPDIYVAPSINIPQGAARVVPDNRFFAATQPWLSHTPERYALVVT